jgi:hypothetical protein
MSFYASLEGYITYTDKESFNKAVTFLKKGDWMDKDGHFAISDGDDYSREKCIDSKTNTITIPPAIYRNPFRFLTEIEKGIKECHITGTSTDGMFEGWVTITQPLKSKTTDLKEDLNIPADLYELSQELTDFAKEQNIDTVELTDVDDEDNLEEYSQYQYEVEDAWHSHYSKKENIKKKFSEFVKRGE